MATNDQYRASILQAVAKINFVIETDGEVNASPVVNQMLGEVDRLLWNIVDAIVIEPESPQPLGTPGDQFYRAQREHRTHIDFSREV